MMNEYLKASSQDMARELDAITAKVAELSFEEIRETLTAVENRFVKRFVENGGEEELVYVHRAVADCMLNAAIDKGLPMKDCLSFFDSLTEIGFGDFRKKCTTFLIFCRYMIRLRDPRMAVLYLDVIEKEHVEQGSPFNWVGDTIADLRNTIATLPKA